MTAPHRILLVDDEPSILTFMKIGLTMEGYEVAQAVDGRTALNAFNTFSPHLVVLDRMLPDLDGSVVCQRIKSVSQVPVLMLTARNEVNDRISGLQHGADDYVGKPVRLAELLARVRALLRRAARHLRVGDLQFDTAHRQVRFAGREVDLTPRESAVLEALMKRAGHVVTREQILKLLWGFDYEGTTNVVEVHIRALRAKLGDNDRTLIRTIRGLGYTMRADAPS